MRLLNILRCHASYRRGFNGSAPGWYVDPAALPGLHSACRRDYPTLATLLVAMAQHLPKRIVRVRKLGVG